MFISTLWYICYYLKKKHPDQSDKATMLVAHHKMTEMYDVCYEALELLNGVTVAELKLQALWNTHVWAKQKWRSVSGLTEPNMAYFDDIKWDIDEEGIE